MIKKNNNKFSYIFKIYIYFFVFWRVWHKLIKINDRTIVIFARDYYYQKMLVWKRIFIPSLLSFCLMMIVVVAMTHSKHNTHIKSGRCNNNNNLLASVSLQIVFFYADYSNSSNFHSNAQKFVWYDAEH